MKNTSYLILCFLASLLLAGCAIKVVPEGGPKDVDAPKVVESDPPNKSTNSTPKEIKIHFDEFIQLRQLQTQLVVSPIITPDPEIKVKGKNLKISLDSKLDPSTTYSINFGNSIIDIHENNVYKNFGYVFSTGSALDTMTLQGRVLNSRTLSEEKGVLVMLYKQLDDSIPLKEKPYYYSITNETGDFTITNIAKGKYKLFALKDNNGNFRYDLPNENIAFVEELVSVDTSSKPIKLFLFQEESPTQKLIKATSEHYGKMVLVFRKPVSKLSIKSLDDNPIPVCSCTEYSQRRDTVTLWMPEVSKLTCSWLVSNGETSDTMNVTMKAKPVETDDKNVESRKKTNAFKLLVSSNASTVVTGDQFKLSFNHPLLKVNESRMEFTEDSLDVTGNTFSFIDSVQKHVSASYVLKENKTYQLIALPGAFTDYLGLTNDTIRFNFKTLLLTEYGSITFNLGLPTSCPNFIFRLSDDNDKTIKSEFLTGSKVLKFFSLKPGKYKISLIYDQNNNNLWDTGLYFAKRQPEEMKIFSEKVVVRPNWELELNWKP